MKETFARLFPGTDLVNYPAVAGPESLISAPYLYLLKQQLIHEFRKNMRDGGEFVRRLDFPVVDQLQLAIMLYGVIPELLPAYWLAPWLRQVLVSGEKLGGVGRVTLSNYMALTVIGVLSQHRPKGIIYLKRGEFTQEIKQSVRGGTTFQPSHP